jgi:probable HAF family extracellular repeat protein
MRDLGTLAGEPALGGVLPSMQVVAINERGDVLGHATWSVGSNYRPERAWLWRAGKLTVLPSCGEGASPTAMNDRGEVAGSSLRSGAGLWHAVVWRNGAITVLVASCGADYAQGSATDISESGQVVGSYATAGEAETRAFLWQDGRRIDLPPLEGTTETFAYAINDRDQIVGASGSAAVLWTRR